MRNLIILLGPPGCGKDTQAELLHKRLGYKSISTGKLIRTYAKKNTDIAQKLEKGELIESKLIEQLFSAALLNTRQADTLISNGFPRELPQAKWLDDFLASQNIRLKIVIVLQLSEEEIYERLAKRNRQDDDEIAVRHRLEIYQSTTQKVIDYYDNRGFVKNVQADGSIKEVHRQICKNIG